MRSFLRLGLVGLMGLIFLFSPSRVRALSGVFIQERGWEGEERDQAHQAHQARGGMGQSPPRGAENTPERAG